MQYSIVQYGQGMGRRRGLGDNGGIRRVAALDRSAGAKGGAVHVFLADRALQDHIAFESS